MLAGTLELDLVANVARLQRDMEEAKRIVGGAMGDITKAAEKAKIALEALGVGLSITALVEFSRRMLEGIHRLDEMTAATGSTVEKLSALEQVQKRAGRETETMLTVLTKFNKVLYEAKPDSLQATALKSIGLNIAELKKLDPADALLKTAKALDQYADDGNKARFTQELFTKSIKEAGPLLHDLAQQQELHGKITTEQAERVESFNRILYGLKTNSEDTGRAIIIHLVEAFYALKRAIEEGDPVFKGFIAALTVVGAGAALAGIALGIKAIAGAVLTLGAVLLANPIALALLGIGAIVGVGVAVVAAQAKTAEGVESAIKSLEEANVRSAAALKVAEEANHLAGAANIRNEMEKRAQEAQRLRVELAKLRGEIIATDEAYDKYEAARNASRAPAKPSAPELPDAAAAKAAAEAYATLIKRMQERIDVDKARLRLGRDLTEAEKAEVKMQDEINALLAKYPSLSRAKLEAKKAEMVQASKDAAEAASDLHNNANYAREWAKEEQELADDIVRREAAFASTNAEMDKARRGMTDQLAQMQLEGQLLGSTDNERRAGIELLKIEQRLTEQLLALDENRNLTAERRAQLVAKAQENAELERQLVGAQKALDDYSAAWSRVDQMGQQVWTDLWTKGSNVLKDLGHLVKTALIDALYQLVVKKWVFSIFADVTGGGAGGVAGAAVNGVAQSGISSLAGGAGLVGAAGGFSSGASAAFQGLYMNSGAMAGASFGGVLEGGMASITSGAIAEGLGAIAGALGPIAIGAALLYKLLDSKHGGPKVEGGSGTGGSPSFGDTATAKQMATAISQELAGYTNLFGLKPIDVGLQFGKDPQGTAMSQLNIRGGSYDRATLYGGNYENVPRGDANFDAEVLRSKTQLIVDNLAKNLTGPLGEFLKSINIVTASTEEMQHALQIAQSVGALDKALATLGSTFSSLKDLSLENKDALAQQFGGVQNLVAGLAAFNDKFLTDAEKHTAMQDQLTASFQKAGVALPATIEAYKAAVMEAQKHLDSDAGRATFQVLIQNAGLFYDAAQQAGDAVAAATDTMTDALKQMKSDATNLQIELMKAQGDTTGAFAAQRFLDTQNMSPEEAAQYDINAGLRSQITAATERKSLQDQLDSLTMTNTELLQKQRDALSASNQELFDEVQLATRAKQVANERQSLQARLDQATMTATELQAQYRATLDASNDALYDEVIAAEHANQVNQTRKSLQDQIWQAEGNTAALRAEELAAMNALDPALGVMQQHLYDLQDAAEANNKIMGKVTDTRQALVTSYQNEANALKNTASQMRDFAKSIHDFRQSLLLNDALTTLTPQQRYDQAKTQFASLAAAAKSGDAAAQSKLQSAATEFLNMSRTMFAATTYYTADFNEVQAVLGDVETQAGIAADLADQQLALAQSQLDKLGQINTTTQSVADALLAYTNAIIAAINAGLNPDNPLSIIGGAAHHANGGWHKGGWSWVGEAGPELRYMPPSRVFSANESRGMFASQNDAVVERLDRMAERLESIEGTIAAGDAMNASATHRSGNVVAESMRGNKWGEKLRKKSGVV